MTRLTSDMIHDVPHAMNDRDAQLCEALGKDLKALHMRPSASAHMT